VGFFKDLNKLNKQGKELEKNWDVGEQLAGAQASMAQANQFMAQQTAAANAVVTGKQGSASVTAIRGSSAMVNMQPVVELDLTVFPPDGPPYPATVSQPIAAPLLGQVQPGCTVPVAIDAGDPLVVHVRI
jgi:hypothetical protein